MDVWVDPKCPYYSSADLHVGLINAFPAAYDDSNPIDVVKYWNLLQKIPSFDDYILTAIKPCTVKPGVEPFIDMTILDGSDDPHAFHLKVDNGTKTATTNLTIDCNATYRLWNATSVRRNGRWYDPQIDRSFLQPLIRHSRYQSGLGYVFTIRT